MKQGKVGLGVVAILCRMDMGWKPVARQLGFQLHESQSSVVWIWVGSNYNWDQSTNTIVSQSSVVWIWVGSDVVTIGNGGIYKSQSSVVWIWVGRSANYSIGWLSIGRNPLSYGYGLEAGMERDLRIPTPCRNPLSYGYGLEVMICSKDIMNE